MRLLKRIILLTMLLASGAGPSFTQSQAADLPAREAPLAGTRLVVFEGFLRAT